MLKAVATRARKAGFLCVLGVAFVLSPVAGHARNPPSTDGSIPPIALAELPPQGRATYALIREGGPFPYDKDGTVFGNRERLLPAHKQGGPSPGGPRGNSGGPPRGGPGPFGGGATPGARPLGFLGGFPRVVPP